MKCPEEPTIPWLMEWLRRRSAITKQEVFSQRTRYPDHDGHHGEQWSSTHFHSLVVGKAKFAEDDLESLVVSEWIQRGDEVYRCFQAAMALEADREAEAEARLKAEATVEESEAEQVQRETDDGPETVMHPEAADESNADAIKEMGDVSSQPVSPPLSPSDPEPTEPIGASDALSADYRLLFSALPGISAFFREPGRSSGRTVESPPAAAAPPASSTPPEPALLDYIGTWLITTLVSGGIFTLCVAGLALPIGRVDLATAVTIVLLSPLVGFGAGAMIGTLLTFFWPGPTLLSELQQAWLWLAAASSQLINLW